MPTSLDPESAVCPVCSGASLCIETDVVPRAVSAMAAFLRVRPPEDLALTSPATALMRCSACGLVFAAPMKSPGESFYRWLTNSGFNYPLGRWEWLEAARLISARKAAQQTLIDVGCGDGRFLELLSDIQNMRAVGVDHNRNAIESCQRRGREAICGGLSDAKRVVAHADIITMWHVVEHVSDPVAMLEEAASLLGPNGLILFSVPLSPMSYEHSWVDPFNLPPHHMTRWNVSSLEALAARVRMSMELSLPLAQPLWMRLLRSLLRQSTPFVTRSRALRLVRLASLCVRHPSHVALEIKRQKDHPRHRGLILPDVALVCLRRTAQQTRSPDTFPETSRDFRQEASLEQ